MRVNTRFPSGHQKLHVHVPTIIVLDAFLTVTGDSCIVKSLYRGFLVNPLTHTSCIVVHTLTITHTCTFVYSCCALLECPIWSRDGPGSA